MTNHNERDDCETLAALGQLLDAAESGFDTPRLTAGVRLRLKRRRRERRSERLALAASLAIMAGLGWLVGENLPNDGERQVAVAPPSEAAEALEIASPPAVAIEDQTPLASAEFAVAEFDVAAGDWPLVEVPPVTLAWNDSLDASIASVWWRVQAVERRRGRHDPFLELRGAMQSFEDRLANESL